MRPNTNATRCIPIRATRHPHTFRNAGDGFGCIVGTFNPPRLATYFRELAAIINDTGSPPDRDTWAELYGRYDTTFYDAG
jgi:hypothetical protein